MDEPQIIWLQAVGLTASMVAWLYIANTSLSLGLSTRHSSESELCPLSYSGHAATFRLHAIGLSLPVTRFLDVLDTHCLICSMHRLIGQMPTAKDCGCDMAQWSTRGCDEDDKGDRAVATNIVQLAHSYELTDVFAPRRHEKTINNM